MANRRFLLPWNKSAFEEIKNKHFPKSSVLIGPRVNLWADFISRRLAFCLLRNHIVAHHLSFPLDFLLPGPIGGTYK